MREYFIQYGFLTVDFTAKNAMEAIKALLPYPKRNLQLWERTPNENEDNVLIWDSRRPQILNLN